MQSPPRSKAGVRAALALGTVAVLALSACAPGGSTPGAEKVDVSTEITSEPVTLKLAYTDDPPTQALIDGFTELYPNVTIEPEQTPFSDYVKSVKLVMASDTPPDIAQYNPGAMRSLIPGGLILDLDPWGDAYGWDDSFPKSSLQVLRSDKEATTYGEGGLYAVPGALSVLGLYYNKDLASKAGITFPIETLADFGDALEAAKASGAQPISVAALEAGGLHLWNAILNGFGDTDAYRDWVFGVPGSSIETTDAEAATDQLVEWIEKGYITESANAVSFGDGLAEFGRGEAVFAVNGNWAASGFEADLGDNVGFALFPGDSADSPVVASGASVAYSISSKSEHPNEAAAFLDYMASDEAAAIQVESGFMPVSTTASVESATTVGTEIATGFGEVVAADGLVPFPDFAAPAMIDSLVSGIQALISKQMTSAEFLASLQATWTEYHG